MNEEKNPGETLSPTGDNNGASTSADVKHSNRPKKKCKKCGAEVKNLSRHQEEVHRMSKMKRKLDVYMTGEKKAPKRRVKFCPLSPCKRSNTPIFQLDKHLQTRIHNLKPNTPAYLAALTEAPRASLSKVKRCLKNERKRKGKKPENKRETKQAKTEETHIGREDKQEAETCNRVDSTEDETGVCTDVTGKDEAHGEYCGDDTTEVEKMKCSHDSISEYSDDDYDDLIRRKQKIIARRSRRITRKKPEKSKFARMKNVVDSDEEYDRLSNKVWLKNVEEKERTVIKVKGIKHDKAQEETLKAIRGSDKQYECLLKDLCHKNPEENRENDYRQGSADDNPEDKSQGKSEEDSNNEDDNEEDEYVVQHDVEISDSEESKREDPDYMNEGHGGSNASGQSYISSESAFLFEECEGLLTELVEVVGEGLIDEGSFLDLEPDWRKQVKDFKDSRLSQGYVFKSPHESNEELMCAYEASSDIEEMLRDVFDGDQSDDDDVLDTEWVMSDCDMDGKEDVETGLRVDDNDQITGELLGDFYKWLIDVDGGYRSDKIAQQYKSQVESVVKRLRQRETETKGVEEKPPSVYLLLLSGKEGVTLLKEWLSYAVEKYQPGTVRSYLMSLRLFYKFLTQERKTDIPNVTVETLNARRDLMTSWSAAQKKKVLKRTLQKHDNDFKKLLSSEQLYKVCHGDQRIKAIKQLGTTSDETNRGEDVQRVINEQAHCEVRDWLMTRLLIDNSGRSGVAANLTVKEFKEAKFYEGTEEDLARWRILVEKHKTAENYGAAVVWVYDDLYKLLDMYLRTVRGQFITSVPKVEQLFVSNNGLPLTSSQVSTSVWRTFQREGIMTEGRISATILRKSLATGMHVYMPDEKEHLAALAQHKAQTQSKYYRVHDKVREADLGRRAVSKFVSLKTANIHQAQDEAAGGKSDVGKQWTAEETEQLRQLFQDDLETGAIEEPKVKEILSTTPLQKERSPKAVVLKLRRMREEEMKAKEPPCQEETSHEKVIRFLESVPSIPPATTHTSGSVSVDSSRFWRKFTEEQTEFLISLTRDLIDNDAIKKEVVWQRVKSDERSLKLGLISTTKDEGEEAKMKQRLTDKVRKMAGTLGLRKSKGKAN